MANNKAHILIIDDEPQIRRFLKATLSSHGYEISEGATAGEGINSSMYIRLSC